MRRWSVALALVVGLTSSADTTATPSLAEILDRAGERVQQYLAQAQSLICLEVVQLMPLTSTWGAQAGSRTVESELRLSWTPELPGSAAADAQTRRQLLRVNGRPPRPNDWNNCTEPEQQVEEPQPLALLLPARRPEYRFEIDRHEQFDRRPTVVLAYRLLRAASVESHMLDGRDDCVSFNVDGGKRGRLWIDAETFDVLRLDESLSGMVDIPLPRAARRVAGAVSSWTLERMDTTIRFKPVKFTDPDQTLVLPATTTSTRITRGSGTPRLRTQTEYRNYRRFLTGGKLVGNDIF